jgi:hypothetical protein
LEEEFDDPTGRHGYDSRLDSICSVEGWYNTGQSDDSRLDVQNKVKKCIGSLVENFIRYHVMDRSVALGMAPEANMSGNSYESMMRNPETGRFFQLNANYDQNSLTVKDIMGNTRTVQPREGLYNNIIREYWFRTTGAIFMASSAVAHLIDEPLFFQEMKPWRQVVTEYLRNN